MKCVCPAQARSAQPFRSQAAVRDRTCRTRCHASSLSRRGQVGTGESAGSKTLEGLSYAQQFDVVFKDGFDCKRILPKPDRSAQRFYEGTKPVIFTQNIFAKEKTTETFRPKCTADWVTIGFITTMHLLCLAAPSTFSWYNVGLFVSTYFLTGCLGITLCFHRQLAHKSFKTPLWLEHVFAYCATLAVQGDPKSWVSTHRYHHLHCDTPMDPHSSYEGFWWSHMGWILETQSGFERAGDRSNVADMDTPFYNHLEKHCDFHLLLMFVGLYAYGGFPAVVWGGALRIVWVWHITWLVNSACHLWGTQPYNTDDLSMNNWWVGILAWGEGWHNNHHAFEWSARHGLEWWQFDMTWQLVSLLEAAGLATNVKLPSEKQKKRLAM